MAARKPRHEDPAVLKRRYPLAEIVARAGVVLRRSGARLIGRCPFHDDTTPSFTVYPDQGSYHCYGCGAHGDVFTFLMRHESCSFPEAVQWLTGGDVRPAPRFLASPVESVLTGRQQTILTAVAQAYAAELEVARALDADLSTAPTLDVTTRTRLQQVHGVQRAHAALVYLRGRGVDDRVLAPALVG